MATQHKFLVVDGYPRESRDQFNEVGMTLAGELYAGMLKRRLPDADYEIWYSSDPGATSPTDEQIADYSGILWPGCNLTVYHDDPRVHCHLDLARRAFEVGTPGFGSCWAIQVASHAAGGEVKPSPKGREMGVGQKLRLTEAGAAHPMFEGKPHVYSHFMSHDDEVTRLPEGGTLLSGNDWSAIQAAEIKYKNGTFWGVQYHPEYNLHEMARLILARQNKLMQLGYFRNEEDVKAYVDRLEALFEDPTRKDLRWQLKIDDDVLDPDVREREFVNWLKYLVKAPVEI